MKINSMKMLYCIALIGVFLIYSKINLAQICDCTEYLYVNDAGDGVAVHKFPINENYVIGDPISTALLPEIGNPWYDNAAVGETLSDPHGLGGDINGNIYIGEQSNISNIRKLTCTGTIVPVNEFTIIDGGFNLVTDGNTLYVNSKNDTGDPLDNTVNAYDLCTGNLIGSYCFNGFMIRDWGMDLVDNTLYVTSDYIRDERNSPMDVPNQVYVVDINNTPLNAPGETNPVCIDPFISETATADDPGPGDNFLPTEQLFGVAVDTDGNIFLTFRTDDRDVTGQTLGLANNAGRLVKYDSNGNFVSATPWDDQGDGAGIFRNVGIVYSETLDILFISNESPDEPCVSAFDTDLNYLGGVVPAPPGSTFGSKGVAIVSECCLTTPNLAIDTVLCNLNIGESYFLQDFIFCLESVCEGTWDGGSAALSYESCNNSITVNEAGCGTFTSVSDGTAPNAQCGAYNISINICVFDEPTAPVISITDNVCNPVLITPGSINVDTPCPAGSTIEYSIDGGINWSATAPVYDNDNPITVQARCVSDGSAQCVSAASIVTSAPDPLCCPAQTCIRQFGEFTIIKRRP